MPPRQVDERKTRKALRKVRRALEASQAEGGTELSGWEQEFAQSVEKRLTAYGSAFRDASKGRLEEPLSLRQAQKLSEIGRKARGKGKGLSRGATKPGSDAPEDADSAKTSRRRLRCAGRRPDVGDRERADLRRRRMTVRSDR